MGVFPVKIISGNVVVKPSLHSEIETYGLQDIGLSLLWDTSKLRTVGLLLVDAYF